MTTTNQLTAQADHYEQEIGSPFCPLGAESRSDARRLLDRAREYIDAQRMYDAQRALDNVWAMLYG